MCNQSLSYTVVWDVVQKFGAIVKESQEIKVSLDELGKLNGDKEAKGIFQEQDGLWLNIQGKDKPKNSKIKRKS